METYKIELTEKQLQLLMRTCEVQSRLMIGQTDHAEDIFFNALKRHKYNNDKDYWKNEEYQRDRDIVSDMLTTLHCMCWNQLPNQFYGVKYSPESDTLIDMVEVIRHQLWQDREGEKSRFTNDSYPAFHWNKKEPLIKIEKI